MIPRRSPMRRPLRDAEHDVMAADGEGHVFHLLAPDVDAGVCDVEFGANETHFVVVHAVACQGYDIAGFADGVGRLLLRNSLRRLKCAWCQAL